MMIIYLKARTSNNLLNGFIAAGW